MSSKISSPTSAVPALNPNSAPVFVTAPLATIIRPLHPPSFKDLLRAPKDVLEEDFVRDVNFKFESLGNANNNFSVDVTHSSKLPTFAALKMKSDPIEMTFFTDSRLKADVNLPVYVVGSSTLKLKLGNEYNSDTKDAKFVPTLEVKHESVNFTATLDSPYSLAVTKAADGTQIRDVPYVPHRLTLQGVFRLIPGVLAGFTTLFNSTGKWENVGLKAEYTAFPTVVGTALNKTNNGPWEKNFYFFHPYSLYSRFGVLLTHTATFSAIGAIETAISPVTTFKTRVDTSGSVGFAVTHRVSSFSKLSASVVNGGGAPPSVGMTFSFSDKY